LSATATQRKFVMDVESLCVLLTVGAVRERLTSYDEADVKAACEDHTLAPAFDIGLGSKKYRVVTPSAVDFFLQTLGSRRRRISEAEMFAEILRGHDGKPWIAGERVRLILNCSADLVNALVDEAELAVMPGTQRRQGPNGSDQITVASFKAFLKRRLL
jgi:hypothetical protein